MLFLYQKHKRTKKEISITDYTPDVWRQFLTKCVLLQNKNKCGRIGIGSSTKIKEEYIILLWSILSWSNISGSYFGFKNGELSFGKAKLL